MVPERTCNVETRGVPIEYFDSVQHVHIFIIFRFLLNVKSLLELFHQFCVTNPATCSYNSMLPKHPPCHFHFKRVNTCWVPSHFGDVN
jgi:hypothetical protein